MFNIPETPEETCKQLQTKYKTRLVFPFVYEIFFTDTVSKSNITVVLRQLDTTDEFIQFVSEVLTLNKKYYVGMMSKLYNTHINTQFSDYEFYFSIFLFNETRSILTEALDTNPLFKYIVIKDETLQINKFKYLYLLDVLNKEYDLSDYIIIDKDSDIKIKFTYLGSLVENLCKLPSTLFYPVKINFIYEKD